MTFKVGDRVRHSANMSWSDNWQNCKIVALPPVGETYYYVSNHEGKIGIMRAEEMELIQPIQTAADRLERLEAFVARVANLDRFNVGKFMSDVDVLAKEVEVDRDLIAAREMFAASLEAGEWHADEHGNKTPNQFRNGSGDQSKFLQRTVEALRRARNEGNKA